MAYAFLLKKDQSDLVRDLIKARLESSTAHPVIQRHLFATVRKYAPGEATADDVRGYIDRQIADLNGTGSTAGSAEFDPTAGATAAEADPFQSGISAAPEENDPQPEPAFEKVHIPEIGWASTHPTQIIEGVFIAIDGRTLLVYSEIDEFGRPGPQKTAYLES